MSALTSIEWTDRTWNPVRGCKMAKGSETKGCLNCYAAALASRNLPGMRSPTTGEPFARRTKNGPRWTGDVELIPSKLDEPLRWKKPARVFVNSMSDLFHEALPDEAIDRVFAVMAQAKRHTFQILTKRPERMRAYSAAMAALSPKERTRRLVASMYRGHPAEHLVSGEVSDEHVGDLAWPLPNVWLGVSVEDQATADERIPLLLQTPAARRFVSYEPALGPVDFKGWIPPDHRDHLTDGRWHDSCPACLRRRTGIGTGAPDWIIVGGESGPGARPFDVEWARSTVRQCKAAGVPVFVKQLGARPALAGGSVVLARDPNYRLRLRDRKGGDPAEWPEDLRVREFPA